MPFFGSAKDAAKDAKEIKNAVGDVKASDVKQGVEGVKKAQQMKEDIEKMALKMGITPEKAAELMKQGQGMATQASGHLDFNHDGKLDKQDLDLARKKAQEAGAKGKKYMDLNNDGKLDQEDLKLMAHDLRDRKTNRADDLVIPLYITLIFCLIQVLTYGLRLNFTWMSIYIVFFVFWFFAWKGVLPDEATMYLAGLFFVWDGIAIAWGIVTILLGGFLSIIWDGMQLCVHGWIFYTIKDRLDKEAGMPTERTPLGPNGV